MSKLLRGLGNPSPPLNLKHVLELLKLDKEYYSTRDDSLLKEVASRLRVAGHQLLARPGLLIDAIRGADLKALYLPDQKRILLDNDVPKRKHRWNEAHEIGHSIIPWHQSLFWGDTEQTLVPSCHVTVEAEANYAAGRLLFLGDRFRVEAASVKPSIDAIIGLSKTFGNSMTSSLWRYVELAHEGRPIVGLVSAHPHSRRREKREPTANPFRYRIESPAFREDYGGVSDSTLFQLLESFVGPQRGGALGGAECQLPNGLGVLQDFWFESFYNGHEALSLGYRLRDTKRSYAWGMLARARGSSGRAVKGQGGA